MFAAPKTGFPCDDIPVTKVLLLRLPGALGTVLSDVEGPTSTNCAAAG
jgi:hypothetical protein